MAKHHAHEDQTSMSAPKQPLIALAYAADGKLLSTGKVSSEAAYFNLDHKKLRNARVFILPEPTSGRNLQSMSLQQLEQLTTFEPQLSFNEDGGIVFEQIPDIIYERWWWQRCCVRGRVTNRASIEGQYETYPVCNATVHICEIDRLRYWIDRIPPYVLERLRRGLIEKIPTPRPPFLDDSFTNRLPEIPQAFPRPNSRVNEAFELNESIQQPVVFSLEHTTVLNDLSYRMQRMNDGRFRQLLLDEYQQLRPLFCYFPYIWPYFYHCEEVAVVKTDNNGRYEACFWYQHDQPDVYVWVEYPFTTGVETVYRPSIPCYTRWNYLCGSDLDIKLYNSRIPPVCGIPLEGTSVAIRTIGHSVSPMAIEQDFTTQISLPGKTDFKTVGLTNYKTGGLGSYSPALANQHIRPYTGSFPIHVQFGDALPNTDIHYFQIQYCRTHNAVLDPTGNSNWKVLDSEDINRRFSIQVGLDFQYDYYPLNAGSVGGESHLYRIPPLDPQLPGIDGIPASTDPTARWSRYDRVRVGQIDTSKLDGDGLYEFRIRFLDGSGNLADVNADFFRVPNPANRNVTMAAPAEYIHTSGGNAMFQFRLRIDNQRPYIAIEGVRLDGADVMTDCGFVEYDNLDQQLGITFSATHPHNFAIWSFNLERGRKLATTNHFAFGDAKGIVTGDKPPYSLDTDDKYKGSFEVRHLLLGCADKAAFSEGLGIVGLHTDGHEAGDFFHRSLSNAFALAPK